MNNEKFRINTKTGAFMCLHMSTIMMFNNAIYLILYDWVHGMDLSKGIGTLGSLLFLECILNVIFFIEFLVVFIIEIILDYRDYKQSKGKV